MFVSRHFPRNICSCPLFQTNKVFKVKEDYKKEISSDFQKIYEGKTSKLAGLKESQNIACFLVLIKQFLYINSKLFSRFKNIIENYLEVK